MTLAIMPDVVELGDDQEHKVETMLVHEPVVVVKQKRLSVGMYIGSGSREGTCLQLIRENAGQQSTFEFKP
jgi:hypothetical protein